MTLDPRQPVLVGVGQVNHRDGDAPEPVELLAQALRLAADDAGAPALLDRIGSIRVANLLSRRYPDPGRLVSERLGIDVGHTVYTTMGGQTPVQLVERACDDIAAGRFDVVVVGGAESWRTRSRIKRRGESSPWSTQPDSMRPSELFGADLDMVNEDETRLGLTEPSQAYPMFEQALRRRHGRTLDEQLRIASALWARMSAIAAHNPYAALRTPMSAESLRTPSPDNRLIGFPYTKLLNTNNSIDQAGALLLTSVETAESLGISKDRWVFLHGAGEGNDVHHLSNRWDLSRSPAIAASGAAALELAGIGIDDVAHVDLYSCYPSAVQVAAEELGLSLDRDLSVTGGLTFAGGPWNAYVVHSTATMAGVLRADSDAFGLVSGNGGLLTKHAVSVWSCRPPEHGTRWRSVQPDLDASVPRREPAYHHEGDADLETYTVTHGRDGEPEQAWAFALLDDGRRTLATTTDPALLRVLLDDEVLDHPVATRDGSLLEVR